MPAEYALCLHDVRRGNQAALPSAIEKKVKTYKFELIRTLSLVGSSQLSAVAASFYFFFERKSALKEDWPVAFDLHTFSAVWSVSRLAASNRPFA